MGLGTWEILLICGVIVLLFGAGAIPRLARNLGRAKNEFQRGMHEGEDAGARADDAKPKPPANRE